MAVRADQITPKEHEVLKLIAGGTDTGPALAEATGRSAEGCHQTAASLVRKGWATRTVSAAREPTTYQVTRSGQNTLRIIERLPGLVRKVDR